MKVISDDGKFEVNTDNDKITLKIDLGSVKLQATSDRIKEIPQLNELREGLVIFLGKVEDIAGVVKRQLE